MLVNLYFIYRLCFFHLDQTFKMAAMINIDFWLTEIKEKTQNPIEPHDRMKGCIVGMLFKLICVYGSDLKFKMAATVYQCLT